MSHLKMEIKLICTVCLSVFITPHSLTCTYLIITQLNRAWVALKKHTIKSANVPVEVDLGKERAAGVGHRHMVQLWIDIRTRNPRHHERVRNNS